MPFKMFQDVIWWIQDKPVIGTKKQPVDLEDVWQLLSSVT